MLLFQQCIIVDAGDMPVHLRHFFVLHNLHMARMPCWRILQLPKHAVLRLRQDAEPGSSLTFRHASLLQPGAQGMQLASNKTTLASYSRFQAHDPSDGQAMHMAMLAAHAFEACQHCMIDAWHRMSYLQEGRQCTGTLLLDGIHLCAEVGGCARYGVPLPARQVSRLLLTQATVR